MLDLCKLKKIEEYIEGCQLGFVEAVRLRKYEDTIVLYIPKGKLGASVAAGNTSERQIEVLRRELAAQFSCDVEVILTRSDEDAELEAGFFRILNRRFNNRLESFQSSFSVDGFVNSWIEAPSISHKERGDVEGFLSDLLCSASLKMGEVHWLGELGELPGALAIIRAIKIMQPVAVKELAVRLRRSYGGVSEQWLSRTLDKLRKKGVVCWQSKGGYALPAKTLTITPAGAQRSSSDIERALALGRRKW